MKVSTYFYLCPRYTWFNVFDTECRITSNQLDPILLQPPSFAVPEVIIKRIAPSHVTYAEIGVTWYIKDCDLINGILLGYVYKLRSATVSDNIWLGLVEVDWVFFCKLKSYYRVNYY